MNSDITQQQQNMQNLIEQIITTAQKKGATQVEVGCSSGSGLDVNVRNNEIDTLEHQLDKELGVTVYLGQRKGNASTTDFSPESIERTLQAALDIARFTSEDEYAGLADADLMCKDFIDLDLYHPWDINADNAIEIARECEQNALSVKGVSNSEGASVNTYQGISLYGNSHGFIGLRQSSRHSVSCSVIAQNQQGMQRDYWYSSARHYDDLENAAEIGLKAGSRAVKRLGAKKIKTVEVPVIYHAEVAKSLIGHFTSAISGGALYRKASFLLDSKGNKIFPEFFSIIEDPHIPRAFGSKVFDSEGVATRKRDIVKDGVIMDYFLSSYSARKLGLTTTANAGGIQNLIVGSSGQSFDELLATMGTGLLITELMGMGVNGITGDYSRGAAGFWVENGEIAYPVEELTVAGNLKAIFAQISAVADDMDQRGVIRSGSILVDKMTVAGH